MRVLAGDITGWERWLGLLTEIDSLVTQGHTAPISSSIRNDSILPTGGHVDPMQA